MNSVQLGPLSYICQNNSLSVIDVRTTNTEQQSQVSYIYEAEGPIISLVESAVWALRTVWASLGLGIINLP